MSKGCINMMPCGKFVLAAGLTIGSFVFGAVMLATGGSTAPLAPFYCSLVTSSLMYWAQPVSYKQKENNETTPLINN